MYSCVCEIFFVPLHPKSENMKKIIIMAEEGERALIDQLYEKTGLDLRGEEIIFTGVGAINIIRSLQNLDRETEL